MIVDNTLNLEFTKVYEVDNIDNAKTGLLWTLSFLGADLKKDSLNAAIKWIDSTKFKIDFSRVGFSENALNTLKIIIDSLKKTEEYAIKKTIDVGAFVSITLGSSSHYYSITDVSSSLLNKLQSHKNQQPIIFPVTKSLVSKHNRLLKLYAEGNYTDWLFIAEEGNGDILNNTFMPEVFEVFDIMQNGQLRFAVYDSNYKLITSSPSNLSEAGKPAKCLWCHEIFIQPLFTKNDSIKGYISEQKLQLIIKKLMDTLTLERKRLNSDIDFSKTQDHSLVERLYLSYMEPSLLKLSHEWQIPVSNLKTILLNNQTHKHKEFNFFGDIYFRDSITRFSPFKPSIRSFDIREASKQDPDFITK